MASSESGGAVGAMLTILTIAVVVLVGWLIFGNRGSSKIDVDLNVPTQETGSGS